MNPMTGGCFVPMFLQGLKELERRKIPYDLLLRPQHLPAAIELVGQCAVHLKMVIDHIAKPLIAKQQTAGWAQNMERISQVAEHLRQVVGNDYRGGVERHGRRIT